jgi:uncharacterized membrane protein
LRERSERVGHAFILPAASPTHDYSTGRIRLLFELIGCKMIKNSKQNSSEELMSQAPMSDITSDDKLWAALGYVIPIIAIVVLFMEDKKSRPYIKFNAVQSLVATVILSILSTVTCGFGAVLFLIMLWWAYQAYMGQDVKIPWVSDFIHKQGWA